MKKIIAIFTIFVAILGVFAFSSIVSVNATTYVDDNILENKAIDEKTESKLIEIKEKQTKTLQDYQEKYKSKTYGTVAYILNIVRIYSIPFCFIGIVIGAIHEYIIGIRKLDTLEKGMGLIVTFVTLLIICQVLPLAFAMFVKFGRG